MATLEPIVYLNGEFLPLSEARVSVLDRGFLFGDGVYEVIPVYGGVPFRIGEHIRRLHRSLDAIRLVLPTSAAELEDIVLRLIHGDEDQSVYLQVTRGYAPRRDHAFPERVQPTLFAMATTIKPLPNPDGVCAITLPDIRWHRCDIKAITLLPNVLLRQEAVERGCAEAILVRDGHATEGAASNLFVVHQGTLLTPPNGPDLLPGITRDLVLELAQANGVPCREESIPLGILGSAEEVWLTSSTREILPVIRIDGAPVGGGEAGRHWRRMYAIYQDYKASLRR